ncbi:MAG: hypothetical protein JXB47_05980 [Anaerolineae bacterium]|nr:hypothetical protein [Anaerolineae bacterium]
MKLKWTAITVWLLALLVSACGNAATPTPPPTNTTTASSAESNFRPGKEAWVFEPQTVAAGEGWIKLSVDFPEGWHINTDAPPFEAHWVVDDKVVKIGLDKQTTKVANPIFPVSVPATFSDGKTELTIQVQAFYCNDDQTLCTVERRALVAPLTVSADAQNDELSLAYLIVPPEIP